ncbi:hypothetical protein O5903_00180 [Escherichia coli]|nr:hypothetical protein [Escherichia coli]
MKTLIAAIIISGSFCAAASAASCRASTAALAGAQAGYAQAQKAAESWAQREKQASNGFQQCLGRSVPPSPYRFFLISAIYSTK